MIEKLEFQWEDTGKLEIDVDGNRSAVLRYKVSDKVVEETVAKINKTSANSDLYENDNLTYQEANKPP